MMRIRIAPAAERDVEAILAWSHQEFGEQVRLRYEELLVQAILDLAEDPERAGSAARLELAPGARTYHLRSSRDHVGPPTGRVRTPRHFIVYRVGTDGCLEIGRVLHESMDLSRHLPPGYQADSSEPGA